MIRLAALRSAVLLVGVLLAGCTSAAPDEPTGPTLPADPDPPVSIRPTTIPPTSTDTVDPPVTDPPPTSPPPEPSDPLATSATCDELFAAATPVLRTALTVLDDALGGRTEQQILDLPATEIDEVFESMTEVAGYDTFSARRQELACTSTASTAGCDDRVDDVAATTLDPLLTDQWLASLGCDAAEAGDR